MITIIMSYAQLKKSKSYSFSQEYQLAGLTLQLTRMLLFDCCYDESHLLWRKTFWKEKCCVTCKTQTLICHFYKLE